MELNNHQFLWLPPLVWKFLNEATVDLVLLAALEQFEYQAANRLLLAMLEECEAKHKRRHNTKGNTTQKDVRKTPA